MRRKIWSEVSVVDPVPKTKVQGIQDRMLSSLSPQARANPNQNPLKVVLPVRIGRSFGARVDKILVPQVRKEIIKIEEKNLSRIILLRIVSRILAEVVHHILVLLRVVMG